MEDSVAIVIGTATLEDAEEMITAAVEEEEMTLEVVEGKGTIADRGLSFFAFFTA